MLSSADLFAVISLTVTHPTVRGPITLRAIATPRGLGEMYVHRLEHWQTVRGVGAEDWKRWRAALVAEHRRLTGRSL